MVSGAIEILAQFVKTDESIDRASSELSYNDPGINRGRERQFIIGYAIGQQLQFDLLITIEYFNRVLDLVIRLSLSPHVHAHRPHLLQLLMLVDGPECLNYRLPVLSRSAT